MSKETRNKARWRLARWSVIVTLVFVISPDQHSEAGRSHITVSCPVDGTVHLALTTISRNRSGGRDSDGCVYSIEGRSFHVHGSHDIITCPNCLYSVSQQDLKQSLTEREKKDMLTAIAKSGIRPPRKMKSSESIPAELRHRLSIVCYKTLSGRRRWRSAESNAEFFASLLLQAAWIERGQAVSQGGLSDFRPQNMTSGLKEYASLIMKIRERKHPSIAEIKRLDKVLNGLSELRRQVDRVAPADNAVNRFQKQSMTQQFLKLQEHLLELKKTAQSRADEAAATLISNESRTLKLRLAQAALRLGLRAEQRLILAQLKQQALPRTLFLAIKAMESHIETGERLLRDAIAQLETIKLNSHGQKSKVQLLLGDLWRRLGERKEARIYLIKAKASKDPWVRNRAKLLQTLVKD
jgi:hypothetical protein